MWSAWPFLRLADIVVLLCIGALVGSGCDGGASKRESHYQRLVGTWTAERLQVDGVRENLDERYTALRIDFRSDEEERTYRMTGIRAEDTTRLAHGRVELLNAQMLQMRPGQGFEEPVTWSFRFETSNSVIFEMPRDRLAGSDEFLSTILPGESWGDAQQVRLDLAREESP